LASFFGQWITEQLNTKERIHMPVILEANYSKKLGLKGYSSHQYSVTVRTEVSDSAHISSESSRLYAMLQACVDRDIQKTGYLPVSTQSCPEPDSSAVDATDSMDPSPQTWKCSERQRGLIEKLMTEQNLDATWLSALSEDRFGKSPAHLNKMEASALIEELFALKGDKGQARMRFHHSFDP
jgi:hypothetical protein